MKIIRILMWSLMTIIVITSIAVAGEVYQPAAQYRFASIEGLAEQDVGRFLLPEIYNKLGIEISIKTLPARRAENSVHSGAMDGEIMRIWEYGIQNPELIRVEPPYYQLRTVAFSRPGIIISHKSDLEKYRLVKVRGVKHTDLITEGMDNVHTVNNTALMMTFVLNGRADVALTSWADGVRTLAIMGEKSFSASQPLAFHPLYHYLNPKYEVLAQELQDVIVEMNGSGELQERSKFAEGEVLGKLVEGAKP